MAPPPPPPPRASAAPPRNAPPSPASTPGITALTPPLSRPSTPGTPARTSRGQPLALAALSHDLSALFASPGLLSGAHFAPAPPAENAYAPSRADVPADPAELLRRVRAGELDPEALQRADAPLLADAWAGAMDRVLRRAEAEEARTAAGTGAGAVVRAEGVSRWAGEVERGLAAAA